MKNKEKWSHAVRVLRIRAMLENKPFVTVKELVEEFGVCRKTVYNDLDALEAGGVPLYSEKVGNEARWQVQQQAKSKSVTMTLNESEVLALNLAQQALSFLRGTYLHAQLSDITKKLALGATPSTKKLLQDVTRKLAVVPFGPKFYEKQDEVLYDLEAGIATNNRLEITYQSPGGRKKQHVIEPLSLVLYRESLYLVANIHKAGKRACFAVERISESKILRKNYFEYPSDFDPKNYFDGAFGLAGGEKQRIEILFNEQQARYMRERHWHASQKFEELPDGRVRMTMEASGMGDVLRWLIGHTGSFEVISPPTLREEVQKNLQTGLELHGAKTKLGSKKPSNNS